MSSTIKVGTCAGRHEMPVDSFVFDKIEDPTNVKALEEVAQKWYDDKVFPLYRGNNQVHIHLYVTGLTVATVAIIKVVMKEHHCYVDEGDYVDVMPQGNFILFHYDTATGDYYQQELI